jgi:hypothetical protein
MDCNDNFINNAECNVKLHNIIISTNNYDYDYDNDNDNEKDEDNNDKDNNDKFDIIYSNNNLSDEHIYDETDELSIINYYYEDNNLKKKELLKLYYNETESEIITKSSNYNNEFFCNYCKNHMLLPDCEIDTFLYDHFMWNKKPKSLKYLYLVFRLSPHIFNREQIMTNKYLRKYIIDYLHVDNTYFHKQHIINDLILLNKYFEQVSNCSNLFIFENLFHQPNLTYIDYLKCDSCKNYMCPKHTYLANCYFATCSYCNIKKWTICGWCKLHFDEKYACKYIHMS